LCQDKAKNHCIAVATESFFNEGMVQKAHWITRIFWLDLTLVSIYSITVALLFYPEDETMSGPFYLGAGIILSTLFVNAWLKRNERKKQKNKRV